MEKEISTYSFLPFSLQTFELCKFSKFRKIISNVISSQSLRSCQPLFSLIALSTRTENNPKLIPA